MQIEVLVDDYSNSTIRKLDGSIGAKVAVGRIVRHKAWLGPSGRGVGKGPAKFGTGSPAHDAIMYVCFVLCVRASVDGKVLGENIDGLIAWTA